MSSFSYDDLTARSAVDEDLPAAFRYLTKYLGSGSTRVVYSFPHDPRIVLKVQKAAGKCWDNVQEYLLWTEAPHPVRRWLAPVESISPCGRFLIQARTRPIDETNAPARLPFFLDDIAYENFGLYCGNVVCHDYAMVRPTYSMKLSKAEWV